RSLRPRRAPARDLGQDCDLGQARSDVVVQIGRDFGPQSLNREQLADPPGGESSDQAKQGERYDQPKPPAAPERSLGHEVERQDRAPFSTSARGADLEAVAAGSRGRELHGPAVGRCPGAIEPREPRLVDHRLRGGDIDADARQSERAGPRGKVERHSGRRQYHRQTAQARAGPRDARRRTGSDPRRIDLGGTADRSEPEPSAGIAETGSQIALRAREPIRGRQPIRRGKAISREPKHLDTPVRTREQAPHSIRRQAVDRLVAEPARNGDPLDPIAAKQAEPAGGPDPSPAADRERGGKKGEARTGRHAPEAPDSEPVEAIEPEYPVRGGHQNPARRV